MTSIRLESVLTLRFHWYFYWFFSCSLWQALDFNVNDVVRAWQFPKFQILQDVISFVFYTGIVSLSSSSGGLEIILLTLVSRFMSSILLIENFFVDTEENSVALLFVHFARYSDGIFRQNPCHFPEIEVFRTNLFLFLFPPVVSVFSNFFNTFKISLSQECSVLT